MKFPDPLPVVNQCHGCSHVFETRCKIYFYPESKWIGGSCPMSSNRKPKAEVEAKMLNPIKASKRKSKGK